MKNDKKVNMWGDIKPEKEEKKKPEVFEKINIWGDIIPGNSTKKKSEVMDIKKSPIANQMADTISWILALKDPGYKEKNKTIIDTYTARWVAKADPEYKETFEDVPFLIPFIAEGSKQAVIFVPGGGYCMKEMDNEGSEIAKFLQKNGITAFVLWYRSNPYYMPLPLMDMQRAVRYVRFNAKNYGYDENKIGAVGFSAGGSQVGLFENVYRGTETEYEGYKKDEIDNVDDSLNYVGLVYPALAYKYNSSMFFASFPVEMARNEKSREEIVKKYDAVANMSSAGVPHFISYGTKDDMVSIEDIENYVKVLDNTDTPYKKVLVEGAGHGYGASEQGKNWMSEYVAWLQAQNKNLL